RENKLTARQARDGLSEVRSVSNRREVDVVYEIHKCLGMDAMLRHQARKRRSVIVIEVLLYFSCGGGVKPKQILDEGGHALVDRSEKIALGRIQRVVEIENPKPRIPESFGDAADAVCTVSHGCRVQ